MDVDDKMLDGDDDKAGKERQKLIYLLAKREKEMQKKLKQLNEDVNYVMRSRLAVDGRKRKLNEKTTAIPIKKNKGMSKELLEKEEESLKKKLEAYKKEIQTYKQKIQKKKEEMLKPESIKDILLDKKRGLEKELKEIKKQINVAESFGLRGVKEKDAKHHHNYNNEYLLNYKSKERDKEEEGWSGQLSKDFRGEIELGEKLDKKFLIIEKEKMDMRVRLKKEIDYFFEKKESLNMKDNSGRAFLFNIIISKFFLLQKYFYLCNNSFL